MGVKGLPKLLKKPAPCYRIPISPGLGLEMSVAVSIVQVWRNIDTNGRSYLSTV